MSTRALSGVSGLGPRSRFGLWGFCPVLFLCSKTPNCVLLTTHNRPCTKPEALVRANPSKKRRGASQSPGHTLTHKPRGSTATTASRVESLTSMTTIPAQKRDPSQPKHNLMYTRGIGHVHTAGRPRHTAPRRCKTTGRPSMPVPATSACPCGEHPLTRWVTRVPSPLSLKEII